MPTADRPELARLGKLLTARKEALGLTFPVISERMGVSREALSKIFGGKALPEDASIFALAKLLGVSNDMIFYTLGRISPDRPVYYGSERKTARALKAFRDVLAGG